MLDSHSVVRRLAITVIIAVCLGGPIAEMFDRWDDTVQDGNDTEADLVVAALCVGVAFSIGTIVVVNRIRWLSAMPAASLAVPRIAVNDIAPILVATPATSPPTILRV